MEVKITNQRDGIQIMSITFSNGLIGAIGSPVVRVTVENKKVITRVTMILQHEIPPQFIDTYRDKAKNISNRIINEHLPIMGDDYETAILKFE